MNKKQLFLTIITGLFLLMGAAYYMVFQRNHGAVSDYRIALFVPAEHPSMTDIMNGFKDTLHNVSNKKYSFDEYNANGNPTLLRAQADEIVQHNYDLVFTVGAQCSQSIFELSQKRQSRMPQVFTAVDNPVAMGIVA